MCCTCIGLLQVLYSDFLGPRNSNQHRVWLTNAVDLQNKVIVMGKKMVDIDLTLDLQNEWSVQGIELRAEAQLSECIKNTLYLFTGE